MLGKHFAVLSLLVAITAIASPVPEEQTMRQYAPGCVWSGDAEVALRMENGITAQAEDKSWGEREAFRLFKADIKEEVFKLYKAQEADIYGKTKIDGDAIATVSKSVIEPCRAKLTISVRSRGLRKVQSLPADTMF
jgi:hypothetical protein